MDPALHLLARLQRRGRFRRWRQSLGTPKGIVFAVVFAAMMLWLLFSMVFAAAMGGMRLDPGAARRDGPLLLMALTGLVLVAGTGGQALYFPPAEEAFLFPGPFRRRELIAFKLRALARNTLLSSVVLWAASASAWRSPVAAFVALYLAGLFLELVAVVAALGSDLAGAAAWGRVRRGVWLVLGVAAAWGAWRARSGGAWPTGPDLIRQVARSGALAALATPFRVFTEAFAADQLWPDLALWSGAALLIDLALVGLVFSLDAGFIEVAAASSARTYAKLQRLRAGQGAERAVTARGEGRSAVRLPPPPWWGGVGPNLWRHMTAALGSPKRLVIILLFVAGPVVWRIASGTVPADLGAAMPLIGTIAWISIFASGMVPHDFRDDVDRIAFLKTLPIAPSALALGEILAPVLLLTAIEALALGGLFARVADLPPVAWSALLFLPGWNLLQVGLDNLLFLWYPNRPSGGQFDLTTTGRQMLLVLGKAVAAGIAFGLAAGAGAAAYAVGGGNWPAALAAAWLVLAAAAAGVVAAVGDAFARFDVAADTPA